jgi:hypothetical protein
MFVRVTNSVPGTWWEDRIGEVHEVREPNPTDGLFYSADSHYILVHSIPNNPYARAITKTDCVIVPEKYETNKNASILLDKE